MNTDDLGRAERSVPPPQPDPLEEVKGMILDLRQYLERMLNGFTENGEYKAGIMPTLQDHNRRLTALEQARAEVKAQQLTWKNALGLTLAGGLISKALDWAQHHLK